MPRTIALHVAVGTVLVLTGPGGSALRLEGIEPFGGVALNTSEVLWATASGPGGSCGWRAPWGRYEVGGEPIEMGGADWFTYLDEFQRGEPSADLTGTAVPGRKGYGVPDGRLSSDDVFFFLSLFEEIP